MTNLINVTIWGAGVACIVISLIANWVLSEDAPRKWLIFIIATSILTIWLAPRDNLLSITWLLLILVILSIFLIFSSRRKDRIYKTGTDFGKPTVPPLDYEPDPPGTQSIFGNLIKKVLARRKASNFPSTGYWSVVFPNPMVLGQEHVIKVNLSPFPSDFKKDDEWLEPIQIALKGKNNVAISIIPIAQSFDIKPNSRELAIRPGQGLSTYFFATPTQLGKHPIRVDVALGQTQLGWFQEIIHVQINAQKVLATVGTLIGFIATLLSILGALKIFP